MSDNIINNNNPYTIDELNNPMHSSYPDERLRDRSIGSGLISPHMTQQGENYNTEAVQNQYNQEWKDFTIYNAEENRKKYLQRKEMNNTSMPISELIKKMAIDAVETLRPKENKTVIELPDIESIMGLLGNAFTPNNVNMQPQVNDMPSYDMMLADNSNANPNQEIDNRLIESGNQYIDPYADAPGPTEPTNEEHRQMLLDMEYNNSPEGYNERMNELRGY